MSQKYLTLQSPALSAGDYFYNTVLKLGYLYRYQIEEEKLHNHILQLLVTTSL